MRLLFIALVFPFFLKSCTDKPTIKLKPHGKYMVEANFVDDSIIDGSAKYYLNAKLAFIISYKNGIRHGPSMNFHSNGKVYDSVNFTYGLENGYHYVYDSSGKLGYVDFYFNGHQFGPEIFYENDRVGSFYFMTFEKFSLYEASYDFRGIPINIKGELVNVFPYQANLNNQPASGVFSYFVHPPHPKVEYALVLKEPGSSKEILLKEFDRNLVFVDTVLPRAKDGSNYFMKVSIYDSSNRIKQIILSELIYNEAR